MIHRSNAKFYLAALVVAVSLVLLRYLINSTSQLVVTQHVGQVASIDDFDEIEIVVWASGEPAEHWVVDGPAKAAANVTHFKIRVNPILYPEDEAGYWADFVKAAEAGQAPDIISVGSHLFPRFIEAGYIVPLGWCRDRHPEFEDVLDELWHFSTRQDQVWGIPHGFSIAPLYFNKVKLKALGWTDEEIAQLPEKIKLGLFTWDDLITTSKAAIDQGVIDPGFGFWHRPTKSSIVLSMYITYGGEIYDVDKNKFILDRKALEGWYTFQRRLVEQGITLETLVGPAWHPQPMVRTFFHDTVSHGRVLFWTEGIWHWWRWRKEYTADLGGDEHLYGFVGYALYPAAYRDRPGITNIRVGFYAITSEQASGRNHQEAACALLAKTTTPEINNLQAIDGYRLGVLKSQADDATYRQHPILWETRYMLDYSWSDTRIEARDELYQTYISILWDFMVKAERGELSPAEAAVAAIEQLQQELGDNVILE